MTVTAKRSLQSKPPKRCKYCSKSGHWPYQCLQNPNKPKYNLAKRSKGQSRWVKTRRQWFIDNPAESYECYYCKRYLTPAETTLDHYHPRGSNPKLRYELSNLVPCCWECNGKKGSVDGDVYIQDLHQLSQAAESGE